VVSCSNRTVASIEFPVCWSRGRRKFMRDRHNRQARSANSLRWRVPDLCNRYESAKHRHSDENHAVAWPGPGGFLRCLEHPTLRQFEFPVCWRRAEAGQILRGTGTIAKHESYPAAWRAGPGATPLRYA
jgi:hypothetical protein